MAKGKARSRRGGLLDRFTTFPLGGNPLRRSQRRPRVGGPRHCPLVYQYLLDVRHRTVGCESSWYAWPPSRCLEVACMRSPRLLRIAAQQR